MRKILLILSGGISLTNFANAAAGTSAVSQLRVAMKREIAGASASRARSSAAYDLQNLLSQLTQATSQARRGDLSNLESTLDRITSLSADSAVKLAAEATLAEAQRQVQDHEQRLIKTFEVTVPRLISAALDAKSAAALDPLQQEAAQLPTSYDGNPSEALQHVLQQTSALQEFLRSLQDYRFAFETDDPEKLRNALQNLQNNSDLQRFMPRSRLLALTNPLPTRKNPSQAKLVDERGKFLLEPIQTFEDVDPAIEAWNEKYTPNEYTSRLIARLKKWQVSYRGLVAGTITGINFYEVEDGEEPAFDKLRNQIISTSIGSGLELLSTLPPAKNETAQAYLLRVFAAFKKRGDYEGLKRAAETSRILMRGNFPHDIWPRYVGLSAYLAGKNEEIAQQWMAAILSYQRGIRDGVDFVPAAEIGQRLADLEAKHPAEYRQGMAEFLGDASPRIAHVYLSLVPDSEGHAHAARSCTRAAEINLPQPVLLGNEA